MKKANNELNILVEDDTTPIYVTKEEFERLKVAESIDDVRGTYALRKWAKLIKQQSDFTCECCGSKDKVVAHHMLSFKNYLWSRIDLKNGICLCSKCHIKYHREYNLENTSPYTLIKFIDEHKEK